MTDIANAEYAYDLSLTVNGEPHTVRVDSRTTLLDLLRDGLDLTGTKKGCDHGQCGACTVLLDGRRVNSCLVLAVTLADRTVTTIEGIGPHPVQDAFVAYDAYQCGYCTPGQICSAVGMLNEVRSGWASSVTDDVAAEPALDESEIRERMSGNLCRCGAYVNIVAAISSAGGAGVGSAVGSAGGGR
jgi:xanthine dehydrogenase YagT iron-sulfur-binding subunit